MQKWAIVGMTGQFSLGHRTRVRLTGTLGRSFFTTLICESLMAPTCHTIVGLEDFKVWWSHVQICSLLPSVMIRYPSDLGDEMRGARTSEPKSGPGTVSPGRGAESPGQGQELVACPSSRRDEQFPLAYSSPREPISRHLSGNPSPASSCCLIPWLHRLISHCLRRKTCRFSQ